MEYISHGDHVFFLKTGPFRVAIETKVEAFFSPFTLLYDDYEISSQPIFADYHVSMVRPNNYHFFFKPQIHFLLDGKHVFTPLPLNQIFPIFEWGLNWAIGNRCNFYLVIHAAILEKDNCGVLLPGIPGAGKSTLCAALNLSGWRLLSDELALIDLKSGMCIPIPRPISLKNNSIEVIRNFSNLAILSETVHDTQKGSVAYLKASGRSVQNDMQSVKLGLVIFPKYQIDFPGYELNPVSRARSLIRVAEQSFNYHIHGVNGFDLLKQVISDCRCYDFIYNGDLHQAESIFTELVADVNSSISLPS